MANLLGPHLIPEHWSDSDRDVLKRWNPAACKVVWTGVPAHLDSILEANPQLVIVRDHALSEQKEGDPAALGFAHAEALAAIARAIKEIHPSADMSRFAFEGINEPELWGKNHPGWVATYEIARLTRLHEHGLRAVVGNFNTGWVGDYGVKDSPPNWEPFAPMFAAMWPDDLLALHEYGWLGGMEKQRPDKDGNLVGGWLWDAGRYLQCPYPGKIVITECGLDNAVATGTHAGWQTLDGDMDARAIRYVDDLLWYNRQLVRDSRIVAAFVFTHDHQDRFWEPFNTRNDTLLRTLLPALASATAPERWGDSRTLRWRFLCNKYADARGLDPRVVGTIIGLESAGVVNAVSDKGAVGLMQVMPHEKIPGRPQAFMLKNPDLNVKTGVGILASGMDAFSGSLAYGLAAYYMGQGGVREQGIRSQNAQHYLSTFARTWRELWPGTVLPGDVADYLDGEAPPPPPVEPPTETEEARELRFATWEVEESIRKTQDATALLADGRALALSATRRLYQVRGLPPPNP